jgi:hypothetical protein
MWIPAERLLATGFMRDNSTLKMEMIWHRQSCGLEKNAGGGIYGPGGVTFNPLTICFDSLEPQEHI